MKLRIVASLSLLLCILFTVNVEAQRKKSAKSRVNTTRAKPALLELASGVEFDATAVTDDPVPLEAKQLNPGFGIAVYYRTSEYAAKPSPEVGGIVARVSIHGVPEERGLPDGDYFLWVGGPDDSMRAVMIKVDGTLEKEVDVLSKPSLVEEAMPHSARVHVVIDPPEAAGPPAAGAGQGPLRPLPPFKPPPPLPKPPPAPPKPPPPPGRTWREICVTPPSDHGGKRWIRVPDN